MSMVEEENGYIVNDEGELLIHEDSITESTQMTAEELAILQASKDAAKFVQELQKEITPNRVATAGLVLLLLLGAIFSTWYWVIPRDSVMVETLYMQRSGHLVMSEIHNTGSREITDVDLQVTFQSTDGEVLESMSIEIDAISAHSSVAGDDLEMLVIGHTVWDNYVIAIDLKYTDHEGDLQFMVVTHNVGDWAWEEFKDRN
tara:strand:- start:281 stop:886 length:606 start_codon:yes stop_codon:yes gene_type:complete